MEKLSCVLLAVTVFILAEGASVPAICRNNTDCGVGECCYIQPEFFVVSKKRQALTPIDLPLQPVHSKHDTGVCEKYHLEQERCYPLETANKHCGCTAGTHCRWVSTGPTVQTLQPVPDLHPIQRRSMIYHPGPGEYRCVTTN